MTSPFELLGVLLLAYLIAGTLYGRSLTGEGFEGDDNLGPF